MDSLSTLLTNFDVCISETHGKNKKDAPSGTAKVFKQILENNKKAPQIASFRGGNVAGIHEITFIGEEEVISIKHTALSRAVFAKGALEVAKKIYSLPAGLYTSI
jgi:4-hydroxy-tetrahydrodipicolinate reductase